MHRVLRYGLVAVVVVALLSVAAHKAMARSGPVDPSLLVASNLTGAFTADGRSFLVAALVRYEGTTYNVLPHFDDCPAVAGVPRRANVLFYLFGAIYRAFSPLYLPGAAVLAVAVGYYYVDEWLQFG